MDLVNIMKVCGEHVVGLGLRVLCQLSLTGPAVSVTHLVDESASSLSPDLQHRHVHHITPTLFYHNITTLSLPHPPTRIFTNLPPIKQDEGFYVTERQLSNGSVSRSTTDGGGAAFGRAVPIQLPTRREVEKDTDGFVSTINRLTSPVFYSTMEDGQVVKGLGGIPLSTRPLLLVGNHQVAAAGALLRVCDLRLH